MESGKVKLFVSLLLSNIFPLSIRLMFSVFNETTRKDNYSARDLTVLLPSERKKRKDNLNLWVDLLFVDIILQKCLVFDEISKPFNNNRPLICFYTGSEDERESTCDLNFWIDYY